MPSGRPDPLGTRKVNDRGYVYVKLGKGHPYANATGWQSEHRLVMMEHLGRRLTNLETVHHIDGDRTNNVVSNLALVRKDRPPPPHCSTCTC